jgi:hypothetical protein
VLVLLIFLSSTAVPAQQMGEPDAAAPETEHAPLKGTSVSNESLPENLRLSVAFIALVRAVQKDPDSRTRYLRQFGLALERSDFELLARLYGDFDAIQLRRQELGVSGEDLLLDNKEFLGGVLGRWLVALKQKGHDVEAFLHNFHHDRYRSVSVFSDGALAMDEIEEQAQRFGQGFEREYGEPLQPILEASKEAGKP